MAAATATTFTFTNFNRVPKPWAGGPILLPDGTQSITTTAPAPINAAAPAPKTKSVAVPKAAAAPAPQPAAAPAVAQVTANIAAPVEAEPVAAANLAPKPFSAADGANSALGLYSAQNAAAAAASQGAVKTDLSTLRQTVVPLNVSGAVDVKDPRANSRSPLPVPSDVPIWSNRNPNNIYRTKGPNYCYTHYGIDFPPTKVGDVSHETPVRIESLPSGSAFRKNPAHQVHVPDRLRLRGGIIEEDDGGVVTERLHKPSEEKRAPHFSGNTIQSRSFNVLEETLAAEGDLGPPATTIDFQTGEIILKRDAPAEAPAPAAEVADTPL